MEDLPSYFDVIVVGTGMPECIIAAAAARVGKKVLHLDRHGYYGGDWASFSFDKFIEWINEIKAQENQPSRTPIDLVATLASLLMDEENLVMCPMRSRTITNLVCRSYVKDAPEPPTAATSDISEETDTNQVSGGEASAEDDPVPTSSSSNEDEPSEHVEESSNADNENENNDPTLNSQPVQAAPVQQQEWTISGFMENRRKFNIDLAPKIMFSRGSLVELLISSNIARYAEFQCITRVLTHINDHLEQVPCSRADVFSTKNVTVVEKRMLMKFLNFCLKFEEQTDEYKGFENEPFVDFLRSKKLTSNVEHYIVHAIAMVDETCNTITGLESTQKFLQSLGRYGTSPFLCTCYGSAELPQCFCRLCAVYEGMYYLKRKVDGIICDHDNKSKGIVSMGQRIMCNWLVMESSYVPCEFYAPSLPHSVISRAILITDSSICPSEKRENTLLRLPPSDEIDYPVTILECSKNYVCPEDLYLVYLSCRSSHDTAEEDLKPAVELLFSTENTSTSEEKQKKKPNILWCVYFNQRDTSTINLNSNVPAGVFLTSSPDVELDYEHAVKEARTIFEKICPGEEFLPRAPDPEDILIEMHNNPGEEGDGGKIENDVNDPHEEGDADDEPKEDCDPSVEKSTETTDAEDDEQ